MVAAKNVAKPMKIMFMSDREPSLKSKQNIFFKQKYSFKFDVFLQPDPFFSSTSRTIENGGENKEKKILLLPSHKGYFFHSLQKLVSRYFFPSYFFLLKLIGNSFSGLSVKDVCLLTTLTITSFTAPSWIFKFKFHFVFLHLGGDYFFMQGDNSGSSLRSKFWSEGTLRLLPVVG
jgi:hypothetical protein